MVQATCHPGQYSAPVQLPCLRDYDKLSWLADVNPAYISDTGFPNADVSAPLSSAMWSNGSVFCSGLVSAILGPPPLLRAWAYLEGRCEWGSNCNMEHGMELTPEELGVLRFKARTGPRPNGPTCIDMYCSRGHHCPMDPSCFASGTIASFVAPSLGICI